MKFRDYASVNTQFLCQCWFTNKTSRSLMFYKIGALENIAKFTRQHLKKAAV